MTTRKFTAAIAAAGALVLAACSAGGGGGTATPAQTSTDAAATDAPATDAPATDSGGESIELAFTWWGNDDRAQRYEEAVDLFEAEHPNIKVLTRFNSWDDYWTARNTEAAGRALPDVMQTDIGYIGQYGQQGLFLDLNPYLGSVLDLSEYSENLLGAGTLNGELVGVPISTTSLAIHYNKDLLDELGVAYPDPDATWEEFRAYLREINEAGAAVDPSVYGIGDYTQGLAGFMYHLTQEGKDVFTPEGEAAFTKEDVIAWLDSAAELREGDGFFPVQRSVALSPLTSYTAGESALSLEWSTMISNAVADLGTENLGIAPPPFGSDTSARGLAEKPGMLLSVGANTKHPEEAAMLVDFLANDPEVTALFGTSRGVPATASGRAAVEPSAADEIVIAYQESLSDDLTAAYPVLPTGYGSIEAKWLELSQELQYQTMTSQEFADALFAEMALTLGK